MRIGIVTATYLPSRNGVATSTALFARGLRELGHEVRIFAPEHPRATEPEPDVYRLPSAVLAALPDYPVLLPWAATAFTRLPVHDLDVVHTMHPFAVGQTALRVARGLGVPLVFTAHTQYHEYLHYTRMPRRLGRLMVRRSVRTFAQAADVVLTPGRAMEDMLRRYKYRGAVRRLPNPIDLAAFEDVDGRAARASLGVGDGATLLVYLGRLAPEKNLDTLLAAFALARAARPGLELLVVGDGPSRAALERRAAGPGVRFAGAVEYARVPSVLAAADAFVTASTSEVLPMSLIEALAAGLPLVAARSPAAEDLVQAGVNGVVCEPTPEALAAGVARVLQNGALPDLRAGALRTARAYDVRARARELADIYTEARAGRSPRDVEARAPGLA